MGPRSGKLKASEVKEPVAGIDFTLFVNSVVDYAIIGLDTTGRVSSWNTGAERVKGYTSDEIIGQDFSVFYPEPDQKSNLPRKLLADAIKNGHVEHTGWRVRKDGTNFWGDVVISAVRNPSGELLGFAKVTRDLTENMLSEKRELKLRTELEVANRMKSQFLANMSHEVRTPLNGIMGMLALLIDSDLDDIQTELAETAHSSSEALLRIVNDILDFSKIEAGRMELDESPFAISQVLSEVRNLFEPQARAKSIRLQVMKDEDIPEVVLGDVGRLRQVLTNLIGNAIKFTSAGSVKISASLESANDENARVLFEVTDTGIGLDENDARRLFDAFSQADLSTTRQFGGTGLGLSISQQLVSLMGGSINVQSTLGKGSTFSFVADFLTKSTAADDVITLEPSGPPVVSLVEPVGTRVLVAEDNVTNQQVMQWTLEGMGYQVSVVDNGQEAVDAVRASDFDLVLMDCQMPLLDGFEATRSIRAIDGPAATIPIIAVTASALPEDRQRCLEAGMTDFLAKPISKSTLAQALSRISING